MSSAPAASVSRAQIATTHQAQVLIRFFDHHRKAAQTPKGQRLLWRAIHTLDSSVRSLQAIKAAKAAAEAYWPPHHQLWLCIRPHEAPYWGWHATPGGHGGGLGLAWDWGYGITGDPGNYSQHDQEWAAERWWATQGYTYRALYGAWYEWDSADGCGTTG